MGYSKMLQWILNDYFLSVLLLTIINKWFKIKASGHALYLWGLKKNGSVSDQ